MKTLCPSIPSRPTALLAAFTLTLLAACIFAPCAHAQEAAKARTGNGLEPATVTPYAEFQNSTLTGTTNTINVSNLPVVTSTGSIIYDNVTVLFDVAANGALTVASTQITAAPSVDVDSFEASAYQAAGAGETMVVSGPGITNGGSTEWSLASTDIGCENQYSAAWYVGPIKSSPYYTRIKAAGVPLAGFSYGIGGSNCPSSTWGANSLLGFSQTGGQMSIVSFTNNGVDQSQQVAQESYSQQQ
jgi:hypothetical protein